MIKVPLDVSDIAKRDPLTESDGNSASLRKATRIRHIKNPGVSTGAVFASKKLELARRARSVRSTRAARRRIARRNAVVVMRASGGVGRIRSA